MKKIIIATAIAAATFSATAVADSKSEAYNACKSEVMAVLGSDTRVALRKIRNRGDVMTLQLRINQEGSGTQTVSCLYNEEVLSFENRDKQPLELAALNAESTETAIN